MDFFAQQDKARRKTHQLILLFILAVIAIIFAVNFSIYLACVLSGYVLSPIAWLRSPFFLPITGLILLVIGLGSLIRFRELRAGGGQKMAELVGARLLDSKTQELQERKLVNVIEEMAIASGMPMPRLYVLDEEMGINAFVAGFKPTEVVLVVTKGCLEHLTREELQGVIGHEFSHIFYGDMRLNLRLIGVLAGILVIGQLGIFILRSFTRGSVRHSSSRKGDKNTSFILLLGLMLAMVGYMGVFFGRLIKAAVSRQREFLADAASVQFTRNPDGIVGALKKIQQQGSHLNGKNTEEMSHMCFSAGFTSQLFSKLLATHPPLEERIRQIDRNYQSSRKSSASPTISPIINESPEGALGFGGMNRGPIKTTPEAISASIGNPTPEHLEYAAALYAKLPKTLLNEVRTTPKAVVYALLLSQETEYLRTGLEVIKQEENAEMLKLTINCKKQINALSVEFRLPLIDLSLPTLKKLFYPERALFLKIVDLLIQIDKQVSPFEYVLQTILKRHLDPKFLQANVVKYADEKFTPVLLEINVLLSALAQAGGRGQVKAIAKAYRESLQQLTFLVIPQKSPAECTPQKLDQAFSKLVCLAPHLKKRVIDACANCVLNDGIIETAEIELLRAITACLDCPMPPLIVSMAQKS